MDIAKHEMLISPHTDMSSATTEHRVADGATAGPIAGLPSGANTPGLLDPSEDVEITAIRPRSLQHGVSECRCLPVHDAYSCHRFMSWTIA